MTQESGRNSLLSRNVAKIRTSAQQAALRIPIGLSSFRSVPVLNVLVRSLGERLVPRGELVWAQILEGDALGVWLELNPRTGQNYLRGKVEPCVQKFLSGHLRAGMVFYDLGANVGFFSLLAAKILGNEGKVFAFEPDPEVFARLRRNVERNKFDHVTAIHKGVWSITDNVAFLSADDSSPDRGVGKITSEKSDGHSQISCISLDSFVATAPPPNVVKIDVEGAEVEVLRGARMLCEKYKPAIVCELHSQESRRDVSALLSEYGYQFHDLDEHHLAALY